VSTIDVFSSSTFAFHAHTPLILCLYSFSFKLQEEDDAAAAAPEEDAAVADDDDDEDDDADDGQPDPKRVKTS
jgi:hypothetical protein